MRSTKYHILALICLIAGWIAPLNLKAQFNFGPKVGAQAYMVQVADKSQRDIYKNGVRIGYLAGFAMNLDVTDNFAFGGELYYSRKGKKTKLTTEAYTTIGNYNFVELPLIFRYKLQEYKLQGIPFKPYVNIGPNFSYWINGSGEVRGEAASQTYKVVFEGNEYAYDQMNVADPNRFQMGIEVGAGAYFPMVKKQFLFVDLRLGIGHTYLAQNVDSATIPILGYSDNMQANYRTLSLSVTYTFQVDVRQLKKGESTQKIRRRR